MTAERITDAELAQLRQLHSAATGGDEWIVHTLDHETAARVIGNRWVVAKCDCAGADVVLRDARLIAAARNALPRLLDEIDRLNIERETYFHDAASVWGPQLESAHREITRLRQERDDFHTQYRLRFDVLTKAQAVEIESLRELVCEVANSGVVWRAGAKYLEVQIGSETWKALQAELEKKP